MKKPRPCPCCSGLAYDACCAPFHRGEREAPDPVALMRSRYSAFAVGEAEYLWKTLHADHPDRGGHDGGHPQTPGPHDKALRSLRSAKDRLKYMGLAILDSRRKGMSGEVLFCATIFERGQDRSFVEKSDFEHDGEGWRYLSGVLVPLADLGRPPEGLGIDEFLALADA
jgi:SEC-C motif-containing protein